VLIWGDTGLLVVRGLESGDSPAEDLGTVPLVKGIRPPLCSKTRIGVPQGVGSKLVTDGKR
jgi:hypothetical protein